jgi:ribosomal-protein-alanine N-acetyltransferase
MNKVELKKFDIAGFFKSLPELDTPRLRLRKLRLSDASDMFEYARDHDVSKYTLWEPHSSIDETNRIIEGFIKSYQKGEIENWAIEYRENAKLIGTCGYFFWIPEYARAEIQYALSKDYWGKGLMTEALHAILDFGFNKMELNRIEAKCMVENAASEKVMQRLGMKYEGILREYVFAKSRFYDLKSYAILKKEWMEGRGVT